MSRACCSAALIAALAAPAFAARPPKQTVAAQTTPLPSHEDLRAARARAVTWLAAQQQPDGALVLDGARAFEIWDTLQALSALQLEARHGGVRTKAWSFVRENVRADGIAYHHRNRGTPAACTETTAFMHLHAPADLLPRQAACELLAQSTDGEGGVRVNTDLSTIPEPLQRYASVTGFALLLGPSCPDYWHDRRAVLVARARSLLRNPDALTRPWQYYGTEYYALFHLVWGLERAKSLTAADAGAVSAFLARRQRADGAIPSGAASPPSQTSEELHTVLALNALALLDGPGDKTVLAHGIRYLLARQQPTGQLSGGLFFGSKREDLYATTLLVRLLRLVDERPRR
jgi:hypothetical protein